MTYLLILLVALLLCGCAASGELPPETTLSQKPAETIQTVPETQPQTKPEPADSDFVLVCDYVPGLWQELRYATDRNFMGRQIYTFTDAYLRYGTVKKLMAVGEALAEQGLYLKIWDAYRPVAAQFDLWEACPDPEFVADPRIGHSNHSRGNAVDVTLVDIAGWELEMPSQFDDFSSLSDRDYSDCTETAAANARLLEQVMEENGFKGYESEWWHFADTEKYPVEEVFQP